VISPQGVLPRLKGVVEHLGKSENVILANVVACAMGATVRPLITLSNPKEPLDEKRYAAFRECLNELTALVCCFAFGKGAEAAGNAFLKPSFAHLPEPVMKKKLQVAGALFSAVGTIGANLVIPQIGNRLVHPVKRLLHLNFDAGMPTQPLPQGTGHPPGGQEIKQPVVTTSPFRINQVSSDSVSDSGASFKATLQPFTPMSPDRLNGPSPLRSLGITPVTNANSSGRVRV
jgi:hypothetical protein